MSAVGRVARGVVDWVPDGEPGERRKWMSRHQERFKALEGIEERGASAEARRDVISGRLYFGLKPGVRAEDLSLETFGYADAAQESYVVFADLKRNGSLAADARFQVSIPPPMEILASFVHPQDRDAIEPVVEGAFQADLKAIEDAVPHEELAIQWDVAVQIGMLEGIFPSDFSDTFSSVSERLARVGDWVSDDVPMAYHFCYGSPYDIHWKEPEDTGLVSRLGNAVKERLHRRLDRLHLPVPIARDDAAYFAPLRELRLDGTQLFLGLLHHEDGLEGARRRIAAAKRFVDGFGVATECGTGRTVADPVQILRLHAEACSLLDEPLDETIEVPEQPRPQPPIDMQKVNAELRAFAEQRPCVVCGAGVGEPCSDTQGTPVERPHMDRHHAALLAHVGQEPQGS